MSGNNAAIVNSALSVHEVTRKLKDKGLNVKQLGKSILAAGDYVFKVHSQSMSGTALQKLVYWVFKLHFDFKQYKHKIIVLDLINVTNDYDTIKYVNAAINSLQLSEGLSNTDIRIIDSVDRFNVVLQEV